MIRPFLRLYLSSDARFGPGKAELLERIRDSGSISAAGRGMGMSYRRAWSLVEEMNAAFADPLVVSARGGSGGGGARVTAEGLAVLGHFRALEGALASAGAPHLQAIGAALAPQVDMSDGKERLPAPAMPGDMSDET